MEDAFWTSKGGLGDYFAATLRGALLSSFSLPASSP